MSSEPRGIRSDNPGNIERDDTRWQGMSDDQSSDPRFIVFDSPEWGIRAIARTLITYQDKYGIATVTGIINRWAPPVENDTGAYVAAVADSIGVRPNQPVDVHDYAIMEPLVRAIIKHENGQPSRFGRGDQWYSKQVVDEGLRRAGVIPVRTVKRVMATPEVIGGGVAGAAGLSAAGAALTESASSLRTVSDGSIAITVIITVIIMLGIGLTVYAAMSRMRK